MIRIPSAYTLIVLLIFLFSALTWILPAGKYDRIFDATSDKEVIVSGTYKQIESSPQGFTSIGTSFFKGLLSAAEIIAYLIIVGGSYGVIFKTQAIHTALTILIAKLDNKAIILIPLLMIIFSALGAITSFFEEGLAFYGIVLPVVLAMGYDSLVALAIIFLGSGTGVLASVLNPFSIGIGSALAHISIHEGMYYRLTGWLICTLLSISYVIYYALKIKKDPTKSYLYSKDKPINFNYISANRQTSKELPKLTLEKKIIVILFLAMSSILSYGVISLNWSFTEMSMVFFVLALISGIVTREKEENFWNSFVEGAKDLLAPAILVGLARAIIVITNDGNIIDTILFYANSFFDHSSKISFVVINQLIQTLIGTLVTSSSGHAALTIPISVPLAEMLKVPLSTVVTSLQYGSGLANFYSPASAVLLASLTITKVPYFKWIKFVLPVFIVQAIITFTIAVWTVC